MTLEIVEPLHCTFVDGTIRDNLNQALAWARRLASEGLRVSFAQRSTDGRIVTVVVDSGSEVEALLWLYYQVVVLKTYNLAVIGPVVSFEQKQAMKDEYANNMWPATRLMAYEQLCTVPAAPAVTTIDDLESLMGGGYSLSS